MQKLYAIFWNSISSQGHSHPRAANLLLQYVGEFLIQTDNPKLEHFFISPKIAYQFMYTTWYICNEICNTLGAFQAGVGWKEILGLP